MTGVQTCALPICFPVTIPLGLKYYSLTNNATYRAVPEKGFEVLDCVVDGVSQGNVAEYTFSNIDKAHNINFSFMHKAVPLTNVLKLVNYKYYEGSWKSLPDFSKLTPVKSGNLTTVTMAISGLQLRNVSTVADIMTAKFGSYFETDVPLKSEKTLGGSVSPLGLKYYSLTNNATYRAVPDKGFEVLDCVVDGVSQGNVSEYVFSNIDKAHNINFSFMHYLNSFRGEPAISRFVKPFTPNHGSSAGFATPVGSVLQCVLPHLQPGHG